MPDSKHWPVKRDMKVEPPANTQQNRKNPSVCLCSSFWPRSNEQRPRLPRTDSCGSLLFSRPANPRKIRWRRHFHFCVAHPSQRGCDMKVGLSADARQNCKNPSAGLRKGLWPRSDEQPPDGGRLTRVEAYCFGGSAIREKSSCADTSTFMSHLTGQSGDRPRPNCKRVCELGQAVCIANCKKAKRGGRFFLFD